MPSILGRGSAVDPPGRRQYRGREEEEEEEGSGRGRGTGAPWTAPGASGQPPSPCARQSTAEGREVGLGTTPPVTGLEEQPQTTEYPSDATRSPPLIKKIKKSRHKGFWGWGFKMCLGINNNRLLSVEGGIVTKQRSPRTDAQSNNGGCSCSDPYLWIADLSWATPVGGGNPRAGRRRPRSTAGGLGG